MDNKNIDTQWEKTELSNTSLLLTNNKHKQPDLDNWIILFVYSDKLEQIASNSNSVICDKLLCSNLTSNFWFYWKCYFVRTHYIDARMHLMQDSAK